MNKYIFILLTSYFSILLGQFAIGGNDLSFYQFDQGKDMSDNDIVVFTSTENVKIKDGKLKLLPLFKNNVVRARLRSKVSTNSEVVVKVDNIPFNADGRIKFITNEEDFLQIMFYDNETKKSLVVSEKIRTYDENFIYRKLTPLNTPILLKVRFTKNKTEFFLGYEGRSFDKVFETDLTLDNFMIQLEASTKVQNYHTGVDFDWVAISTKQF